MIEMTSQFCAINLEFHDTEGKFDDRMGIIVHAKDFNTINHEIEEMIEDDEISSMEGLLKYLVSLDDRGIYYREVVKFYLHDINPGIIE
jgi:hypothetical protein